MKETQKPVHLFARPSAWMSFFRRVHSQPRSQRYPDWCSEEKYPGLPGLLEYYGGSLSCEESLPLSTPLYDTNLISPEAVGLPDPSPSPQSSPADRFRAEITDDRHNTRFAPKLIRIFEPLQVPQDAFDCAVCGPSRLTRTAPPKSSCQHYVSCSECQSRVVRKLLRCRTCCQELTEDYPVCGPECLTLSDNSQILRTAHCPRCGDKLAKETCSSECNRKKIRAYKRCYDRLAKEVAVMVLHPEECARMYHDARPCCHYTRCDIHGNITRGRSNRCSACRRHSRRARSEEPLESLRQGSLS